MENLTTRLQQAVDEGIIEQAQYSPLVQFLQLPEQSPHIKGKFDLSHTVWFLGAALLLFACIIMAVWVEDEFNNDGLVFLYAIYVAGFYTASRYFYHHQMRFLSALLLTSVVLLTPIWLTLTAELMLGITGDSLYSMFCLLLICTAGMGLHSYRFPLLIVPVYGATIGLLYLWFDVDLTSKIFWLITGWLTIALAWFANLQTTMNMTFWLNKIAAAAITYGLSMFVDKQANIIDINLVWICVALLIVSVYLRYPSFVMGASIGIVTYLNYLVWDLYSDYIWAIALVIAIQACLLIAAGVSTFKHRQKIDLLINRYCPLLLVKIRPTPLPEPLSFGV
ncbi:hypothetical protein [Neptunicella marina]|uniref:DUF2157 domain-containing protein n=1 Tax=Neptunicella marina TaxID=2125989 RepID=A0A8J6LXN0_9ALTE|nr:hypothetical protein [Neptunicella marina]MBC3765699.1 hypothetical protein [Neptunicella marina]